MILAVASGKGGTGKTTFAVNLAYTLAGRGQSVRLLDCDVEEPNDHLFVQPEFTDETAVKVLKPVLNQEKCTGCGKCAETCNYNAIALVNDKVLIFNELCHSCGVCSYVCPEDALSEQEHVIGKVQVASRNEPFFFAHGVLNIGEALAPKIVKSVKQYVDTNDINILDASPGTSCSVVEAIDGADVAVLVTEPTPFGLNDLKLAVGLSLKMKVPTGIVINRSDGNDAIITEYAESVGIPVVGHIPFNREYAETYSTGNILINEHEELKRNLLRIYVNTLMINDTTAPSFSDENVLVLSKKKTSVPQKGNASSHKEITVISGKGGTGKTTILASFAVLAKNKILADNDVDAADLHLLLSPSMFEAHDFIGGQKASVDYGKCAGCEKCMTACHFDAIHFDGPANDVIGKTCRIDELSCEGCGFCHLVCPVDAITYEPNVTGQWYVSETRYGTMTHARLGIAEENSGKLVAQVRNRATELAKDLKMALILGDGPPGTGCPVIASVSGTDLVVIVTEPTVSGVHDMERVFKLTEHFDVPALVIINKADLNAEQASIIEEMAREHRSRVIARIPFDRNVNDALMAGKTVIEHGKCLAEEAIRKAWKEIQEYLRLNEGRG